VVVACVNWLTPNQVQNCNISRLGKELD
jgi:hypothetical protein